MRVSFGACVRACVRVRVPDTGVLRTRNRSGVKVPGYESGYFVGPTVLADVKPHMSCYTEEIFGPVRGARALVPSAACRARRLFPVLQRSNWSAHLSVVRMLVMCGGGVSKSG